MTSAFRLWPHVTVLFIEVYRLVTSFNVTPFISKIQRWNYLRHTCSISVIKDCCTFLGSQLPSERLGKWFTKIISKCNISWYLSLWSHSYCTSILHRAQYSPTAVIFVVFLLCVYCELCFCVYLPMHWWIKINIYCNTTKCHIFDIESIYLQRNCMLCLHCSIFCVSSLTRNAAMLS